MQERRRCQGADWGGQGSRLLLTATISSWRRGLPEDAGVLRYIAAAGSPELRVELARADGYSTVSEDYDWTINQQEY
jgi:hypothetical protein